MRKKIITILTLIATIGSAQAMIVLHDVDTRLLGDPAHRVTITECNHRTVYAAYPLDAVQKLDYKKHYLQGFIAASSAACGYLGFKAISSMIENAWHREPTIISASATYCTVLSALSYMIANAAWETYDKSMRLFQRLIHSHNTRNSLFASDVPTTYFPQNNEQIAQINAQDPNLVWFRLAQERIELETEAPLNFPHTRIVMPGASAPLPLQEPTQDSGSSIPSITQPQHQELECSICFELIQKNNPTENMALPCAHLFHAHCIRAALASRRECPECNHPVDQE